MRATGFPKLRSLVLNIEKILLGRCAAALDISSVTGAVTVVPLPLWAELTPAIKVGEKHKKNPDLVLPARIEWSVPPLVLVASGETVAASWRITNMGHNLSGTVTVSESGVDSGVPGQVAQDVFFSFSARDLGRKIERLSRAGEDAKWEILHSFETYTRAKLEEANRILAQELSEFHGSPIMGVLDDIALDGLLTEMLFGEGDSSIVSRMVDRALDPNAFKSFDPARYFTFNLKSRAIGEVRRTVGDPHIGPKIRRLQKRVGATDIDALVRAYNEQYPTANLGRKRAAAALSVAPSTDVGSFSFLTDDELLEYASRRGSSGSM